MKQDIKDLNNKKVGDVSLSEEVFGLKDRPDILHQVVRWQLAKKRSGNHSSKGISDIRGTTRKPWRQKGTGRARAGSLRSPQFRGGAVIFGPVVRSHAFKLPKKVRALGLKIALSNKVREGNLVIVNSLDLKSPKTATLVNQIKSFGSSILFVDADEIDHNFSCAASNIGDITTLPNQALNVYDIMRRDKLVITKAAIESLEKRLK